VFGRKTQSLGGVARETLEETKKLFNKSVPKGKGAIPKTTSISKAKASGQSFAQKSLYTTNKSTKEKGIEMLTKSFGDRKSALEHARDFWAKEGKPGIFHHATKESSPFVFEKGKSENYNIGLRQGVSNVDGLYVSRDPKAVHDFYNMAAERGENIVTYRGNPKLLDLTDEKTMQDFVKKFTSGEKIERELAKRGFDGLKYFDPYATGEEIVITNIGSLKVSAFNGKSILKTNLGKKK